MEENNDIYKLIDRVKGIKPLGHYAIVEVLAVDEKTSGGIIMSSNTVDQERAGRDIGIVRSFGATAYKGFSDCDSAKDWGLDVGDLVELKARYNNKTPRIHEQKEEYKNLRIVTDSEIIAKYELEDE